MRKTTGSVKKVKIRGQRKWQVRMTYTNHAAGKRVDVKRLFDKESDARQHLWDLLIKHRKSGSVEKMTDQLTFTQAAEKYAALKLIPATYSGEKKIAGRRELSAPKSFIKVLIEHFGRRKLRNIRHSDIEHFKLQRLNAPTRHGNQRSVRAVNAELQMMNAVMNFALRNGWIEKNPFKQGESLMRKADETARERVMSYDEEARLLNVCVNERAHLRSLVIAAVDTGLRRGELFKLDWTDIDFDSRMIHLPAIKSKTGKARDVAMTSRVYDELLKLQEARQDDQSLVFGITDNIKRAWATACRLAGIEDLHFHDLRHSFVTRAISAGVPVAEAMKTSGHVTLAMLSRYLNPDIDAVKRVATALDALNERQSVVTVSELIN